MKQKQYYIAEFFFCIFQNKIVFRKFLAKINSQKLSDKKKFKKILAKKDFLAKKILGKKNFW